MIEQLQDAIGRQRTAAAARPETYVHRRVGQAAAASSRKLLLQAQADLMTAALQTFVALLYETVDGALVNVAADGRVLIPTPWSRARHSDYGLSDGQHRTLRRIMAGRIVGDARPLMIYDSAWRAWILNRRAYPALRDALGYVQYEPITAADVLRYNPGCDAG